MFFEFRMWLIKCIAGRDSVVINMTFRGGVVQFKGERSTFCLSSLDTNTKILNAVGANITDMYIRRTKEL